MITTKAVLAMLLMTAGSATGVSVAYLQAHPLALTGERPWVAAAQQPPLVRPLAPPSVVVEEAAPAVVTMAPVTIVGVVHRRMAVAVAAPTPPAPCSEWATLATGPEGRRVRLLCDTTAR